MHDRGDAVTTDRIDPPHYKSAAEAARAIGAPTSTVSRWVKSGRLAAEEIANPKGGRPHMRILEADLLALVKGTRYEARTITPARRPTTTKVTCSGPECDVEFEVRRARAANYHEDACRQRAYRWRRTNARAGIESRLSFAVRIEGEGRRSVEPSFKCRAVDYNGAPASEWVAIDPDPRVIEQLVERVVEELGLDLPGQD